jgi:hypothetical protein
MEQKARPVNYDTAWIIESEDDSQDGDSAGPSKKHCRRGRELELLCCNDVVAPPLWTLPMTHNPTYLQHLYEVAIQAQEEDIYAPLEFESDFDDDDEEEAKDLHQFVEDKKFSLSLNSEVSAILGPELEAQFLDILKIDKKDSILANASFHSKKSSKKSSNYPEGMSNFSKFGNNATGRIGHDVGISFSGGGSSKPGSSGNSNRQVSMRVLTPYGMGVIVEEIREADGMQKVALDWGALCVFNYASIQMITESQQMKDSVGNVLPRHIRKLLTRWTETYGKDGKEDDSSAEEDESEDAMDVQSSEEDIDDLISPYLKFIVNCLVNVCGVQV